MSRIMHEVCFCGLKHAVLCIINFAIGIKMFTFASEMIKEWYKTVL